MSAADPSAGRSWKLSDFDYPVPDHARRFGYSVGGVAFVGIVLLVVTGILMALFYDPSVDGARRSVLQLGSHPLGLWLRSFHRYTAEAVLFLIILHLARIVFTASYRGARTLNWLFGVGLLVIITAFFFSGTVLKWDQEGYEAYEHLVESIELLPLVGAISLFMRGTTAVMRLFATHTLVLPALLLLLVVPHLVLMKLNELSPLPDQRSDRSTTFFVHLGRVFGFSLVVYGVIAFLAAQFPEVLYPGPYTGVEMTKPPWVFLALYALEDWLGLPALLIAPIIAVVGLIVIPFVDGKEGYHSTVRRVIVWGFMVAVALLVFMILYAGFTPPVRHIAME